MGQQSDFFPPFLTQGLKSMSRLYVHLSADYDTAVKIGKRHGKPVVLSVDAERMARDERYFICLKTGCG